ncbi:MAG: hypothetical protein ACE5F6_00465 [Anaerolineae bacterium]
MSKLFCVLYVIDGLISSELPYKSKDSKAADAFLFRAANIEAAVERLDELTEDWFKPATTVTFYDLHEVDVTTL